MADINCDNGAMPGNGARDWGETEANPVAPETILAFSELLFFAYRDFTRDADSILSDIGFGRAHHRVLHFVNRRPGLRVADLLGILNITKQSLSRVLRQLIGKGYIVQRHGEADRRERLLYATPQGAGLAAQLALAQTRRLAEALGAAGADGAEAVARFLSQMVSGDDAQQSPPLDANGRAVAAQMAGATRESQHGTSQNIIAAG